MSSFSPDRASGAPPESIVVVGGGPAGLTAALTLARRGGTPLVLERSDGVGGLARTYEHRGFRFDLGGHRFFTKAAPVQRLWEEVLGPDLLRRPRLSRIYYRGRFFHYPLRPLGALRGLGLRESALVAASWLRWQLRPHPREDTFEEWVTNRFGRRLFRIFFEGYTEKVWGVSCRELRAEWAAQRIKDLSLRKALVHAFVRPRRPLRTLIEEFHYPRLGPGMLWEAVARDVGRAGGRVETGAGVTAIEHAGGRVTAVEVERAGCRTRIPAAHVLSSMPLPALVACLRPEPPETIRRAAARLTHRDFLTVCLIVRRPAVFPDNWIYVHDPGVRVGRIQNFKNWSPDMVPDPSRTSLGLEYFCTAGDAVWNLADDELIALARGELAAIGLVDAADVEDGCVIRTRHAYPLYDGAWRDVVAALRAWLDGLANLHPIGRNGLHHYDNQDHAMLTGMRAAENVLDGARRDVWTVNGEDVYLEEVDA